MTVRYLYNSSGDYVAFVDDDNVFNPIGEWLGVIRNGNEVYNTEGLFVGILLNDDRVVIDRNWSTPKVIARPKHPVKPIIPIRPLRRISTIKSPFQIDIFENIKGNAKKLSPLYELKRFDTLIGSAIEAQDGTFLGEISKNRLSQDSIANTLGPYGSPYSETSIFNEFSPYGGEFGVFSPFNQFTNKPPHIIKNKNVIGFLTVNKFIGNRIDANQLLAWINIE